MSDLSAWPALVLTAGLATRLRPLSDVRAKAALPVAGTPIIGRILTWLRDAGVRRVIVNLHHRPDSITRVIGDGSGWGLDVRYSWERRVLGSAGGPRHALPLLDAPRFLVVNGDTLTDCGLGDLVRIHQARNARVTMAVVTGDVERYGGVLVDDAGQVRGFGQATAQTRALHFIGVQAVESSVFAALPDDEPHETVRTLYPQLLAEGPRRIAAFESRAQFLDVGTARDYHRTVLEVAAREAQPIDVGQGCTIAADARLENTILWDRVTIEPKAALINCIVADDVVVPAGARYEHTTLVRTARGLEAQPF